MSDRYYSQICDIKICRKSKTKHINSRGHLYRTHFVRKTHTIGDVVWSDLQKKIHDKVIDYKTKLYKFETIVKYIVGGENIKISYSNNGGSVRLYSFGYASFCYQFCVSKKIRDFLYQVTASNTINLLPETIIKNLSITFISD